MTTLGCVVQTDGCYWQSGAKPRLRGPKHETALASLNAWLAVQNAALSPEGLAAVQAWDPAEAEMPGVSFDAELETAATCSPPQLDSQWDGPFHAPGPVPPPPPAWVPPVAAAVLPPPPPPPLSAAPTDAASVGAGASARPVRPLLPLSDFSASCWAVLDNVDLQFEFALDCPTVRFVPKAARTTVADATEELLRITLRAERSTLNEVRAWKLLLLRERLLFWAPLRLGEGRRRGRGADLLDLARLVRERVGRLLRGDWESLLSESRASGEALAARRKATQYFHKK